MNQPASTDITAQNYVQGNASNSNIAGGSIYINSTIQQTSDSKLLPKLYKFPPLTQFFSQRDSELTELHTLLQSHKKVVVYGMGGLGKSELVNAYARKHQADYAHLFWLSAESGDILQNDLRQLAEQFGIDEKDNWFELLRVELNRHADSLLILDNLDEFEGDEWQKLKPLLQALSGCSVTLLLTSRCEPLTDMAAPLSLKLWQAQQSRAFLLQRTGKAEPSVLPESEALTKLIAEFAGLPLALEQAGAFIKQKRCGFADYWQKYEKEKSDVLRFEGVDLKHQPLLITLELALEKQSEAARQLFNMCAFLNSDAIPEEIVEALIEGDYTEARNALLDYSLLEYDEGNAYLRQHRLLQQIAKSFLKPEAQKTLAEAVIAQVTSLFPYESYDISTWQTCQRLLISALACDELSGHFAIENEAMAYLYNQLALYLDKRHADYAQALPFYQQAYQLYEKLLGENHTGVATSLNNLAEIYRNQSRYEEALPLYQRSLAIWEQQLGENHPDVALSLNNLALLYYGQGRYEEALPLYQRSLAIREQQLGENHPDVAQSLNNLAELYRSQGRYEEALPLYQRALAIWEQQLGKNHPDVALSLNNLAELYRSQGRYEEALPLYQRSLAIREQQLGENHPDVAQSLNNLAELYSSQGRVDDALPLYQRSLAIWEQQLGKNHPDVATSLNNLAGLYANQGRYEEALPLFKRALNIQEKKLGESHPNFAISLWWIADTYQKQSCYEEAGLPH
jgi:tetratricopeptide (TPR) repeat protein